MFKALTDKILWKYAKRSGYNPRPSLKELMSKIGDLSSVWDEENTEDTKETVQIQLIKKDKDTGCTPQHRV